MTKHRMSEYEWIVIYLIDGRIFFSNLYKTLKGAERQKHSWETEGRCKAVLLSVTDLMDWEKRGSDELERMML